MNLENMTKVYARSDSRIQLKVIPGHFVTSQSHITHYLDLTTMKSRTAEAQRIAHELASNYEVSTPIDTIICMDGLEVIGAYLSEELTKAGIFSMNAHQTIYVITPEFGNAGQLIFRDNYQPMIKGKNILILNGSITTGSTLSKTIESVLYYGGIIRGIAAIFSRVDSVAFLPVYSIFKAKDVPDYHSYPSNNCPLCQKKQKIDALVKFAKDFGAKGLAYIAIHEDGSWKSSFSKFMTEEQMEALIKAMDGQAGDLLLFAADRNKIVWNVLGALRLELAEQMGLLDKNEYRFVWITEFPLLEWSDEENRFTAMHHPFTMPMDEDLPLLDTDPGAVRAKAYDIVLNGTEIGGGSVRIHQNDVQEKMFEMLGFTKEQAHERFGFLLDAFKYGVPPHAGLAYGLDRLVMLMAKEDSIRDVIAFPKVKDASDLMSEAPGSVDEKQLEELGIAIVKSEDSEE